MAWEQFIANTNAKGKVRRETLEGETHVVVPMSMLVNGVVPGSKGPLLYPPEEMKKPGAVLGWNNRPVVVYHPEKNGKPSTAADPSVLNRQKVGVVLNNRVVDQGGRTKWKAEAWINERLGKQHMPEVMEKIDNGKPVEISTGLYTTNEEKEGEYDGKKYVGVAKDYVPDHLAILPTGKGACSVADGAGLLQNAKGMKCADCGGDMSCPTCAAGGSGKPPTANAMSYQRVFQTLAKSLDEKFGPYRVSVQDVYPGFMIYGKRTDTGDLKLFKQEYKIDKRKGDDDQVSLVGDSSPVTRVTEYRTQDGKFVGNSLYDGAIPGKESDVDKTKLVDSVIANSNGQLDESDREWLLKKTEAWLGGLPGGQVAATRQVDTSPVPTPTANAAPATPVQPKLTFQDFLANADPEVRAVINEGLAARQEERTKLVATITANKANTFTPEQLAAMNLPTLRGLATLASPPQQSQIPTIPVANWAGAGGFVPQVPVGNAQNGGQPTMPVLNLPASSKTAPAAS